MFEHDLSIVPYKGANNLPVLRNIVRFKQVKDSFLQSGSSGINAFHKAE